jgi:hypothetical protein
MDVEPNPKKPHPKNPSIAKLKKHFKNTIEI